MTTRTSTAVMTVTSLALLALALALPVDAANWTPFATSVPPFAPITHPLPVSRHWSPTALPPSGAPVPTCRWWQNIVLHPSNQPITISPLSMRIEAVDTARLHSYNRTEEYESCRTDRTGTHCPSWPRSAEEQHAAEARLLRHATGRRGFNFGLPVREASVEQVATFYRPGFALSAVEPLQHHQVTRFDTLSVTVQMAQEGSDGGDDAPRVELPLVRGMPYATAVYRSMTPLMYTSNAILSANDADQPGEISANKLRLKMNNEQTVLVYAWQDGGADCNDDEGELQWKWDRNTVQLVGPGEAKGNWVVRIAFLPAQSELRSHKLLEALLLSGAQEDAYDKYAWTYPRGGSFDYEFAGSGSDGAGGDAFEQEDATLRTSIAFETASRPQLRKCTHRGRHNNRRRPSRCTRRRAVGSNTTAPHADTPLLMMSLPHAQATMTDAHMVQSLQVQSVTGTMVAVEGSRWTMATPAVPMDWQAPRQVDPARVDDLKNQLLRDIKESTTAGEPDPYGFGKSISKLGRLALIGAEVGMDATYTSELVAMMKEYLAPWLEGSNPNALRYDQTYGGVVSTNGLKDQGADFGQGYYNDHHFHYGYILYGCAIVAKFDAAWAATFRDPILALVRDYANPSTDDPYFTQLRQFDIFDSHSWAAGLFVFADGRNQESSSESINSYYALGLLGQALQDPAMESLGRALMTLEIQGTKSYWHSTKLDTVYPEVYAENKCVGMVWSDKVVDATWFAAGKVFIHGINMLPFTPASEFYLTREWVEEEYPVVTASVTGDTTDEWKGFLYGTHCVIDSQAAWKEIGKLVTFDGGNTRSNLMYFCATRPPQGSNDDGDDHDDEEDRDDEDDDADDEPEQTRDRVLIEDEQDRFVAIADY